MRTVGDHGLVCPDGTDYSAIPLVLLEQAEAINEVLSADQAAFDNYNDRPWAIVSPTVGITIAQFTSEYTGTGFYPGASLLNGVLATNGYRITGPPFIQPSPATSPNVIPAGWYYAGGFVEAVETGAVTANSRRDLVLEWSWTENGVRSFDHAFSSSYATNVAAFNDNMSVDGFFYADGLRNYSCDLVFSHKNAASTMQTLNARAWIFYLGTGLVI